MMTHLHDVLITQVMIIRLVVALSERANKGFIVEPYLKKEKI